jgi:hypothetical protein
MRDPLSPLPRQLGAGVRFSAGVIALRTAAPGRYDPFAKAGAAQAGQAGGSGGGGVPRAQATAGSGGGARRTRTFTAIPDNNGAEGRTLLVALDSFASGASSTDPRSGTAVGRERMPCYAASTKEGTALYGAQTYADRCGATSPYLG